VGDCKWIQGDCVDEKSMVILIIKCGCQEETADRQTNRQGEKTKCSAYCTHCYLFTYQVSCALYILSFNSLKVIKGSRFLANGRTQTDRQRAHL